jgi:hypothetical protein
VWIYGIRPELARDGVLLVSHGIWEFSDLVHGSIDTSRIEFGDETGTFWGWCGTGGVAVRDDDFHVVRWAWTVTAAMGFEYGVDFYQRRIARRTRGERSVNSDLALPQFAWCLGLAITMRYYYTSSYDFFRGEILCAMSFSWWIMSKHRAGTFSNHPEARVYTWREYCYQDGVVAAILLCIYRFQQYHSCARWGM